MVELTPAIVWTYLDSLEPGACAGQRQDHCGCPLARALSRATGSPAFVGLVDYAIGIEEEDERLPEWARLLIARIDRRSGSITARGVRRILAGALLATGAA